MCHWMEMGKWNLEAKEGERALDPREGGGARGTDYARWRTVERLVGRRKRWRTEDAYEASEECNARNLHERTNE